MAMALYAPIGSHVSETCQRCPCAELCAAVIRIGFWPEGCRPEDLFGFVTASWPEGLFRFAVACNARIVVIMFLVLSFAPGGV